MCPSDWFYLCPSDGRCIFKSWLCDRDNDCSGGEDEANCTYTTTTAAAARPTQSSCAWGSMMYHCRSGSGCVWNMFVCDGVRDCDDGSDEIDCDFASTKAPGAFRLHAASNIYVSCCVMRLNYSVLSLVCVSSYVSCLCH